MIELQKRYSAIERRTPVMVVDLLNDPDMKDVPEYLIKVFGKEKYLDICKQANDIDCHWIVVDEYYKDYWFYNSFEDIVDFYCNYSMFDKKDKSTFPYWFAHWCSFQLTALNLGIWKFRYLFHDAEKPWLKLFMSYDKIQPWHRTHNKHHLEYGLIHGFDKVDWQALMIDWECSHLSKKQCPLNCREEMERKLLEDKWKPYEKEIRIYLESLLNAYYL